MTTKSVGGIRHNYGVNSPRSDDLARILRGHVFVDETKTKDYVVAASTLLPNNVGAARKALRGQLLPGQDRIHFAKEGNRYRHRVLGTMCELDVQVTLYIAATRDERAGRAACLNAVLDDVIKDRAASLVVERDESLMKSDLELISRRLYPVNDKPTYRLEAPRAEPLLWISDAVAWCFQRGGEWTKACQPLISDRRRLEL
ncbi:hypothetical protein ACIA03_29070 [Nocardioides sp. NPDC051685]|uniref:hypothetical protein n=1 Tax=Nocardioides sp. NPDC051685 TaxID=3364334 RepID=UPI0037960805